MSWYKSFAMQLSMGRKGEVKKLTIGRPDELFLPFRQDVGIGEIAARSHSPQVFLQKASLDLLDGEVDGVYGGRS